MNEEEDKDDSFWTIVPGIITPYLIGVGMMIYAFYSAYCDEKKDQSEHRTETRILEKYDVRGLESKLDREELHKFWEDYRAKVPKDDSETF